MRCVCWSADFSEARVVEAMFRAQGVPVFVFDAGMAQLDWFKSLAIGGYRIMVPESQLDGSDRVITAQTAHTHSRCRACASIPWRVRSARRRRLFAKIPPERNRRLTVCR